MWGALREGSLVPPRCADCYHHRSVIARPPLRDAWTLRFPRSWRARPDGYEPAGRRRDGSFVEHAITRRATCPACGEDDRDDGDGFCSECGHRLVFASGAPSISPAEVVGRWSIRERARRTTSRPTARGRRPSSSWGPATRSPRRGARSRRCAGTPGSRGCSRTATTRAGEPTSRCLPLRAGRARSPTPRGRSRSKGRSTCCGRPSRWPRGLSARRFAATPMRSDAFLADDGRLVFARLRSGRRLAPGQRLDARAVTEAVGGALLPEPGVRGSPRLVRLLAAHYVVEVDRPCTLESERAELPTPWPGSSPSRRCPTARARRSCPTAG